MERADTFVDFNGSLDLSGATRADELATGTPACENASLHAMPRVLLLWFGKEQHGSFWMDGTANRPYVFQNG